MPNQEPLPTPGDFAQKILDDLKADDRTVGWLARKINVNDSTLRFQLENPQHLKVEYLLRIGRVLKWSAADLTSVAGAVASEPEAVA